MGDYAFYGSTGLTNITIPSSVTSMGYYAFSRIPSITVTVPFTEGNQPSGWDSNWNGTDSGTVTVKYQSIAKVEPKNIEDWEYETDTATNTITIKKYKGSDTEVIIPNSINGVKVTQIGTESYTTQEPFLWDDTIRTKIKGTYAYKQETTSSVVVSDGIEKIGAFSFIDSVNLTKVKLPNSVTMIGDYAFGGCTSLTSVLIPDNVKR